MFLWIGLRFPWQTDRKRFDSQGRQIQAETGQGDVSIYAETGQGDVSIYVENGQGKCFDS
ncbi:MAG: hypothetical protein HXK82_11705 [Lachnospiraceae bacterium]|nr:hypothetical protein [Lachnospiraceae bacterium]